VFESECQVIWWGCQGVGTLSETDAQRNAKREILVADGDLPFGHVMFVFECVCRGGRGEKGRAGHVYDYMFVHVCVCVLPVGYDLCVFECAFVCGGGGVMRVCVRERKRETERTCHFL